MEVCRPRGQAYGQTSHLSQVDLTKSTCSAMEIMALELTGVIRQLQSILRPRTAIDPGLTAELGYDYPLPFSSSSGKHPACTS